MTQSFLPIDNGPGGDTVFTGITVNRDNAITLRSSFSGPSFPSTPIDGQVHWDSDDQILYIWDNTNTAWVVVTTGISTPIPGTDIDTGTLPVEALASATKNEYITYDVAGLPILRKVPISQYLVHPSVGATTVFSGAPYTPMAIGASLPAATTGLEAFILDIVPFESGTTLFIEAFLAGPGHNTGTTQLPVVMALVEERIGVPSAPATIAATYFDFFRPGISTEKRALGAYVAKQVTGATGLHRYSIRFGSDQTQTGAQTLLYNSGNTTLSAPDSMGNGMTSWIKITEFPL